MELTILMPCLNEAETLEKCITKAHYFLSKNNIIGEILISDNGSTDGSQDIAERLGAKVIHIKDKGYGAALIGGIKEASGEYVIMGDSDDSYDFSKLELFVLKLREGFDLVMGNRFLGGLIPELCHHSINTWVIHSYLLWVKFFFEVLVMIFIVD